MKLINADALVALNGMDDNTIDSLVTDPPAGISFMNKDWDKPTDFIKNMTAIYIECLRVLKPGAHGLVWAIPRTSHWTATALEQAGFEIRDVITHIFGSGFPKSLDVSKAIDKMYGAEREIVGYASTHINRPQTEKWEKSMGIMEHSPFENKTGGQLSPLTTPATEEAKKWQGFGTALKPASEHWLLVRKPLGEKTVAKNVLKHGCGALNIDESRIGYQSEHDRQSAVPYGEMSGTQIYSGNSLLNSKTVRDRSDITHNQGRFPANLVLSHNEDCELVGTREIKTDSHQADKTIGFGERDYNGKENEPERKYKETVEAWQCVEDCAVKALDEQSGLLDSGGPSRNPSKYKDKYHETADKQGLNTHGKYSKKELVGFADKGGASRFFYCAKASKRDRGEGNIHPTVKSTKLMEYLIRLITPPQGTVLDPFMGSGSTGVAAKRLGFKFVGSEMNEEYYKIAVMRVTNGG